MSNRMKNHKMPFLPITIILIAVSVLVVVGMVVERRRRRKQIYSAGLACNNWLRQIDSVKEHGPYIVIAPNIALPHARPESGSKKVGFSVLRLDKPVAFSDHDDHKARLLIALSCVDSTTHLEILQSIVTILSDEEKHNAIFNAKTTKEILDIFS